jgi:protein involved in temperature-dependent protein secretion
MTEEAVKTSPDEPAYQITLIRMLVVEGRIEDARQALQRLATLNIGGRLNGSLDELRKLPNMQ